MWVYHTLQKSCHLKSNNGLDHVIMTNYLNEAQGKQIKQSQNVTFKYQKSC
jgi:hypothetical protein